MFLADEASGRLFMKKEGLIAFGTLPPGIDFALHGRNLLIQEQSNDFGGNLAHPEILDGPGRVRRLDDVKISKGRNNVKAISPLRD
jgi:hypothetical protein